MSKLKIGGHDIAGLSIGGKKAAAVYQNGKKIWPDLPAFTPLSYITLDGVSYIDTGLTQLNISDLFMDMQHTSLTANGQYYFPFGVRPNAANNNHSNLMVTNMSSNRYIWQYGATMAATTVGTLVPNVSYRTTITVKNKTITIAQQGGSSANATSTAGNPTVAGNMYLGAGNQGGAPITGQQFIGKVYSFYIMIGGVKAIDLTPVLNNATGEYGMLDAVSGRFFGNAAGGGVIGGGG